MAEAPVAARRLGARGEDSAAAWLASKGWTILARNYRCRVGEIDIVAEREGLTVFVEVKSWRRLGSADLEYAIGPGKRRRLLMTARHFLSRTPGAQERRLRFDVLLVRAGRIEHLENAFGGSVD